MRWRQGIPNSLTLMRLLMAPVFPFVPSAWRMPMLAIGLLSEYLDGYLARRLNGASAFGRVLDPIADKLFVLSVMVVLVMEGVVGPAEMVLVMARDILVVSGVLWFFGTGGRRERMPRVEPTLLGKVTTAAQILFLILVMWLQRSPAPLVLVTAGLSLWSGVDYLMAHRDVLSPARRV